MSETAARSNPALAARVGGMFRLGAAGLALFSVAVFSRAFASEEEPPAVRNLRVLSNQSVALDEVIGQQTDDNPNESATDSGEGTGFETEGETPAPSQASYTIQRQPIEDSRTAPLHGQSAPWYRTGPGALAIVLAFVGGVFLLVRRWIPSMRVRDTGVMRVVARTSLTPKHHAALVQLGRRFVMVGVSPDRVQTLCEINSPDEVADLTVRTCGQPGKGATTFDEKLLHEACGYRQDMGEEAGEVRFATSRERPMREPLTDLLHKLRALRTK